MGRLTTTLQTMNAPLDTGEMVYIYCCSVVSCLALYIIFYTSSPVIYSCYRHLAPHIQAEWDERLLSQVHSIVVAIYAGYYLFSGGLDESLYVEGIDGHVQTMGMITSGFLSFDLVQIIRWRHMLDFGTFLHHTLGVAAFLYGVSEGHMMCLLLYAVWTEASTPFVNFRWFMASANMKTHGLYYANGIAMVVVFFLVRVTAIPWMLYIVYSNVNLILSKTLTGQILTFGGTLAISLLNSYWFSLMFRGLMKALSKRDNTKKDDDHGA